MVNNCLTNGQKPLPKYQKCWHLFDLSDVAAYNAALSNPTIPDES
jgi:hypothetical protein